MLIAEKIRLYEAAKASTIRQNIHQLCNESGYKMHKIAELTGVNRSTVYGLSRAEGYRPTLYTALKLCEFFEVDLLDILGDRGLQP